MGVQGGGWVYRSGGWGCTYLEVGTGGWVGARWVPGCPGMAKLPAAVKPFRLRSDPEPAVLIDL